MTYWWPWLRRQAPTYTSDSSGRSAGNCERCGGYGMVMLDGRRMLCWDHYCAEMQAQRDGEEQSR